MQNNTLKLILIFLSGILILTPSFYQNQWKIVEPENYRNWQTLFDRVVVARLVKTRQEGFLSSGGLLGLGDIKVWKFTDKSTNHQYDTYKNGKTFESYLAYKSLSGFQGIVFGFIDRVTDFSPEMNLAIFRGMVALGSSLILSLIAVWIGNEFGWLAAILTLVSSAFSEWLILPAGSIYWNLWAFYLPLVTSMYWLAYEAKKNTYHTAKFLLAIFLVSLTKILFNGFELITTTVVMATVPFVYYALRDRWGWSRFLSRLVTTSVALFASVVMGLLVLSMQIIADDGNFSNAISYISDTFTRRAVGNPQDYIGVYAESMRASYFEVILIYLKIRAFSFQFLEFKWEIMYLHLVSLFAIFTAFYLLRTRLSKSLRTGINSQALIITTWYSTLAPLSWLIVFKPNAYIHTFLYPMVWHMPFILFGFALCGFLLQNLFLSSLDISKLIK